MSSVRRNSMAKRGRKRIVNTLVIGDLHEPFCREGYLEHCLEVYKKEKCKRVVFIGDILDNHYLSYHEKDPDGEGQNAEFEKAKEHLKKWYEAFPEAYVVLGNHDRLARRKAFTGGISKRWIKSFKDVIGAPEGWIIGMQFDFGDGVIYSHGDGEGTAIKMAIEHGCSCVHGHLHSLAVVTWHSFVDKIVFGMNVGCGVDHHAYAMHYVKENKKKRMILSCGVVYRNGEGARIFPMKIKIKRRF